MAFLVRMIIDGPSSLIAYFSSHSFVSLFSLCNFRVSFLTWHMYHPLSDISSYSLPPPHHVIAFHCFKEKGQISKQTHQRKPRWCKARAASAKQNLSYSTYSILFLT